jgi:hypothetical protein
VAEYQLPDEPLPSRWSRLSVNPVWPLLALMLGGLWLAWPWFAFNAFAMGSPTRRREWGALALGLLGVLSLSSAIVLLAAANLLAGVGLKYAWLGVTIWKLAIGYFLHAWQGRSFALYEYYGGSYKNGLPLLLAGAFLRRRVLEGSGALALLFA